MAFEIPIGLFIFKRDKVVQIIDRLREVKPSKLYILADYGRNAAEIELAKHCREVVEKNIDWDCEVIKNYAEENRGVYANIGLGASWVLEREKWAIFLEDDNLPEISFFQYCKEMLEKYENEEKVLWICGTNYLGKYISSDGASYMFTRHLLPCGWASWSKKFLKYYSGELKQCVDINNIKSTKKRYIFRRLYIQYKNLWMGEYRKIARGERPRSWDYQMDFTLKYYDLLGVSPTYNQIKNIGVDELSEHGGNSFTLEMTRRFCGMDSYALDFPLKDPEKVAINNDYEKKIGKILLYPLKIRLKLYVLIALKKIMGIPEDKPLRKRR